MTQNIRFSYFNLVSIKTLKFWLLAFRYVIDKGLKTEAETIAENFPSLQELYCSAFEFEIQTHHSLRFVQI